MGTTLMVFCHSRGQMGGAGAVCSETGLVSRRLFGRTPRASFPSGRTSAGGESEKRDINRGAVRVDRRLGDGSRRIASAPQDCHRGRAWVAEVAPLGVGRVETR